MDFGPLDAGGQKTLLLALSATAQRQSAAEIPVLGSAVTFKVLLPDLR